MWQFLTALIPYLQNVSWKNVIHNIAMIPKWLRRLLIFIVILGAVYFGYGKFFQERIVVEL